MAFTVKEVESKGLFPETQYVVQGGADVAGRLLRVRVQHPHDSTPAYMTYTATQIHDPEMAAAFAEAVTKGAKRLKKFTEKKGAKG